MRPMEPALAAGLEIDTLHEYGLAVVLPASHPLASRKSVSIGDLASEDFIMFPLDEGTTLTPQVRLLCRHAGFEPKVVMEAREALTIIGLVGAGCGITVLPQLFDCIGVRDVCFRPLDNPEAVQRLVLVNLEGNRSRMTATFREIALAAVAKGAQ
jgi:DNA-binding transcriptional LysR family regulator